MSVFRAFLVRISGKYGPEKLQIRTLFTQWIELTSVDVPLFVLKQDITLLYDINLYHTAQKMKFSIKEFFSKCDQIRSFLFSVSCGFGHIY